MTQQLSPWDRWKDAPDSEWVIPAPRGNLIWVSVDLDGTVAKPVWTAENPTDDIGAPIASGVEKLRVLRASGLKIVIYTARAWTSYEAIEHWLRHHDIPFDKILPGKLLAMGYADDRAIPADAPDWSKPYSHVETINSVLDVAELIFGAVDRRHLETALKNVNIL